MEIRSLHILLHSAVLVNNSRSPRRFQLEDVCLSDGRIFRFDVRRGDATLIQCPNGQQILVDGGPTPSTVLSRLGRQMPFWDHTLDLVVLTHPEEDHITGLVDVLARYEVGHVLDSGQECDSATCEAWRKQIEEKQIPYLRAEAGMTMELGQAVRLHVLHPPATLLADTSSDVNNNSIVLRLEYGRFSALLTGDIEHEGEEALLALDQPVDSLVLKVPHHGGDNALTLPFLQAANPQVAIISVGSDNRFGHPAELTLEKLENVPTYRTDQQGNIEVVTDGDRYWVSTER
jgi:competence protein ComEC